MTLRSPNEWPKKEDHEGHEVRWKDGVSKEYGVHGVAVVVDFDICIADGICISVCPVNVFDKMDFPASRRRSTSRLRTIVGKHFWIDGKPTRCESGTVSSAEHAKSNAPFKPSRSLKA